jgi:hypothetical protein
VINTSDERVEVRDIDSAGQDVIDGRPTLDPGESLTLSGVQNSAPPGPMTDRSGVVHVTTNGNRTTDYAHGIVNLRDRLPYPLTLEKLNRDVEISFDYYEGPGNEGAAPDEVFVLFEGEVRSLDDTANAQFGDDFGDLEKEQQVSVANRYLSQYDASYLTLDEITTDAYDSGEFDFDSYTDAGGIARRKVRRVFSGQFQKGLDKPTWSEVHTIHHSTETDRSLYHSQLFVPTLAEPEYTLDELTTERYDRTFGELTAYEKVRASNAYREQFHVDSHSLDEIASIFGHQFRDLGPSRKDRVVEVFKRQFTDEKLSREQLQNRLSGASDRAIELLFLSQYVGARRGRMFLAVEHFDDGVEPEPASVACSLDNKRFRTVNVTDALFDGQQWQDIELSEMDLLSGDALLSAARRLRDDGLPFSDAISRYGWGAKVVAVGFGAGFTTTPTAKDVYYDSLTVRDTTQSTDISTKEFDFPATVPATATFRPPRLNTRSRGTVSVTVELTQEEMGVELDDLIARSVRLNRFSAVTPPVERGVSPTRVNVTPNGRAQIWFDTQDLVDLLDDGSQKVIATGLLDIEQAVTFSAVGSVEVFTPGGGPGGNGNENAQSNQRSDPSPAATNPGTPQSIEDFLEMLGLTWLT